MRRVVLSFGYEARVKESLRLLAQSTRALVQSGALRGAAFHEVLRSVPFVDRDAWVDELLGIDGLPPDQPDLPRGSVPCLPCGVDEILAMVTDVPLRSDDELVDLGSGLGRVVILANLLTEARASGVEIQEHLVRSARRMCDELALSRVSFVHANAVDVELDGSIFFLYAPFNGETLKQVLRRIEEVARRRSIVIVAVGLELRDISWLVARKTSRVDVMLYDALFV